VAGATTTTTTTWRDVEIERTDVIVQLTTLRHENNRLSLEIDRLIVVSHESEAEERRKNKSTNICGWDLW
jgi:hypothetical protein